MERRKTHRLTWKHWSLGNRRVSRRTAAAPTLAELSYPPHPASVSFFQAKTMALLWAPVTCSCVGLLLSPQAPGDRGPAPLGVPGAQNGARRYPCMEGARSGLSDGPWTSSLPKARPAQARPCGASHVCLNKGYAAITSDFLLRVPVSIMKKVQKSRKVSSELISNRLDFSTNTFLSFATSQITPFQLHFFVFWDH